MTIENQQQNNVKLEKEQLTIGFIPLTDCATLAVAKEKGFFKQYGLDVTLSKEASWANIRDKLAYGILDAAQMLATMPITSSLGTGSWKKETISSLVLGVNGNAITVSCRLYEQLKEIDPNFDKQRPVTADTLKILIEQRKVKDLTPLTFAHVFPASTHNYFLRYWLASAGIDPDHDVILNVIPPQQMVKNLENNMVDGFCVGEPWNQQAIVKGLGHVLITSYEIWNNAPEKVLGLNKEWAYSHPNTHRALIKALIESARWIDDDENRVEVAKIISQEEYTHLPEEIILPPLLGKYRYHPEGEAENLPQFNLFYKYNASFPWLSQAEWYMSQMIRWGDISDSLDIESILKNIFWVDFHRQVMEEMGLDSPTINKKSEGLHAKEWEVTSRNGTQTMSSDLFFDGQVFEY